LLVLCFLYFSGVLANQALDPIDTTGLTKPLIVDPNALTDQESANVASVAQLLANEPASAKESPPPADEDALAGLLDAGTGSSDSTSSTDTNAATNSVSSSDTSSDSTDSSSSSTNTDAITKEIQLLTSLIDHGKAIAAALPAKEQRLNELSAQLDAAGASQKAAGAKQQLAEQKLLLAQIELKIDAMKQKLEDLDTTHTKLQASITKVEGAVSSSDAVVHDLNQKVAVASVGTGGVAAPAAAASAAAPAATSFLDQSIRDAAKVTKQARAALGGFSKQFQNLIQ